MSEFQVLVQILTPSNQMILGKLRQWASADSAVKWKPYFPELVWELNEHMDIRSLVQCLSDIKHSIKFNY